MQSGNALFDGPCDRGVGPGDQDLAERQHRARPARTNRAGWGSTARPTNLSGDYYKTAINNYVLRLHKYDLIPILELHWVGPGTQIATRQQPMPDADHAAAFWADVATTFLDDDGVVLEPYNEPFPDGNKDSDAAWACWRDGCTANQSAPAAARAPSTYQAAGMQAIVDAIRGAGSTHVILLGGDPVLERADAVAGVQAERSARRSSAPRGTSTTSTPACRATCWDVAPAAVAAAVPLVATEIGAERLHGRVHHAADAVAGRSRRRAICAWSWNAFGACVRRR